MTDPRTQILHEAVRIGDHLIEKAIPASYGPLWETLKIGEGRVFDYQRSTNLYSGGSGICLFLAELYLHTSEQRFLDAAISGMNQISGNHSPDTASTAAFYTGDLGIAYSWCRLFQITGNSEYLDEARRFTAIAIAQLDNLPIDDFINGKSGALLGLLLIHQSTGDHENIEVALKLIKDLIRSAHISKTGIYWDKTFHQISGLCGLSHGASGIGISFLEAAKYLNEPALADITKLSFLYENQHYVPEWNNWKDLRKGSYNAEEVTEGTEAWKSGNSEYFYEASNMTAWCHGAAGIGMTRLRAVESLEDPLFKKDLDLATKKVIETETEEENPYPSFNLCHGTGGNLDLLIDQFDKHPEYSKIVESLALKAIGQPAESGFYLSGYGTRQHEDLSLFMGEAAIGHFLLRTLDPSLTPSILLPRLSRNPTSDGKLFTRQLVRAGLLKKLFPQTVAYLSNRQEQWFQHYLNNQPLEALFSAFASEVEKIESDLTDNEAAWLKAVLKIEQRAFLLETNGASIAEQFYDQIGQREKWQNQHTLPLNEQLIVLTRCEVFEVEFPFEFDTNLPWSRTEPEQVIVVKGITDTRVNPLSELGYYVLKEFSAPTRFIDALNRFLQGIDFESEEERKAYADAFEEQVRSALSEVLLKLVI